ncbi:MAG: hypothetical protein UR81_C0022G0007 [Candidatus Levybacteria bacterium GW2011_GWB1_35_5]|nr:MAG: hypothetical protein UR81_C0022G0007 [Candidatus Levybacteria bacterium GW2011_GWB1_35_5]
MAIRNPLKTLREKNLAEAGFEVATSAAKSVREELDQEWRTFMKQALGTAEQASKKAKTLEGELQEGEEISFAKAKKEQQERHAEIEPGIDYRREVIHAETVHAQHENRELRVQLEQIRVELKKIVETSQELEATFKEVAKETVQQTVKPGKYHVSFFEWMLSTIQNARVRIESSASWVSAISGKKSKKDYWSLSKSQGTSFSLSGERVVAQQTG